MANHEKDGLCIGKRLGRLIEQYELRRAYAKYKAGLMEQERLKASAIGNEYKSMQAKISMEAWTVYETNLHEMEAELMEQIKKALLGYNSTEKNIWWLYFIENKSSYEIESAISLNSRSVQRAIAAMKKDMELKFLSRPRTNAEGQEYKTLFTALDLANFIEEKPSEDYVRAVRDLMQLGFIDLDALEFDGLFQDFLEGKRP